MTCRCVILSRKEPSASDGFHKDPDDLSKMPLPTISTVDREKCCSKALDSGILALCCWRRESSILSYISIVDALGFDVVSYESDVATHMYLL